MYASLAKSYTTGLFSWHCFCVGENVMKSSTNSNLYFSMTILQTCFSALFVRANLHMVKLWTLMLTVMIWGAMREFVNSLTDIYSFIYPVCRLLNPSRDLSFHWSAAKLYDHIQHNAWICQRCRTALIRNCLAWKSSCVWASVVCCTFKYICQTICHSMRKAKKCCIKNTDILYILMVNYLI